MHYTHQFYCLRCSPRLKLLSNRFGNLHTTFKEVLICNGCKGFTEGISIGTTAGSTGSCDALFFQHTVKIRTKFCSLAKYEILVTSSRYGDCMANNHFITKAFFPCLGIFQLHVASSSLCSFGTFFINFGGCAEP